MSFPGQSFWVPQAYLTTSSLPCPSRHLTGTSNLTNTKLDQHQTFPPNWFFPILTNTWLFSQMLRTKPENHLSLSLLLNCSLLQSKSFLNSILSLQYNPGSNIFSPLLLLTILITAKASCLDSHFSFPTINSPHFAKYCKNVTLSSPPPWSFPVTFCGMGWDQPS